MVSFSPYSISVSTRMAKSVLILAFILAIINFLPTEAEIVEHTFNVRNLTARRLCQDRIIPAVNGQYPGPTIELNEGDTVVVHVVNELPYGITIHWHGVRQLVNSWHDGVGMITQCPIKPGKRFTHRFNVTGQEGTLWWHAHVSYLRETIHGALVIHPKGGPKAYPFPKPDKEVPIILGEWWTVNNILDVEKEILHGEFSSFASAFTINGKTGDQYNCTDQPVDTFMLEVEASKTYLLRIIGATMYRTMFFEIAGHSLTVVGVDASYTNPYKTDIIIVAPGQTVDALLVANANPAVYYMSLLPYEHPLPHGQYWTDPKTRGILKYVSATQSSSLPVMPQMPDQHDVQTIHHFFNNLTSLIDPRYPTVPVDVDEKMFITFGLGSVCKNGKTWCEVSERLIVANMNNVSFQLPSKMSILEAYYAGAKGVFMDDFPSVPPKFFDFTDKILMVDSPIEESIEMTKRGTKVRKLKYNTTVELVLQSTAILGLDSHAIHLHGFNFFVVARGFGNYNTNKAARAYNLVNPQVRNTVSVPTNGWAVIRFVADNPGVWFVHCHLEQHVPMGMAMVFVVENGPTPDLCLRPPPTDLPSCFTVDLPNIVRSNDTTLEYYA